MSEKSQEHARGQRRRFLRMRWGDEAARAHPPWAVAAQRFESLCTRCGACVRACPERVIVRGSGGFPEVDFQRAGCSFCGLCANACETRALDRSQSPVWQLRATIGESCLAMHRVVCRTCAEQCESNAIRFQLVAGGVAVPLVAGEQCTGCGACVGPCPVNAIHVAAAPSEETSP